MNLLCPNCQKMIQVLEQYAGQAVRCPLCAGTFTVPVLPSTPPPTIPPSSSVTPSGDTPEAGAAGSAWSTSGEAVGDPFAAATHVSPPPSSSTGSPSAPSGAGGPPAPGVQLPSLTSGYQHIYSIWVSPKVVKWIPVTALIVVFACMFSNWIVVVTKPDEPLTGWQTVFGARSSTSGLFFGLFYLVGLLVAVGVHAMPFVPKERLPTWLPQVLPYSSAIVGGVVALAFLFLFMSMMSGFTAESSVEMATNWFRVGKLGLVVTIVGAALDVWLTLRGPRLPLPRIDITW